MNELKEEEKINLIQGDGGIVIKEPVDFIQKGSGGIVVDLTKSNIKAQVSGSISTKGPIKFMV